MKKALKVSAWIVLVLIALLTVQIVRTGKSTPQLPEISYSEFLARIEAGQVRKVTITCNWVRASDTKGADFNVTAPSNQTAMLEMLRQHGVEIWFRDAPTWPNWVFYLIPAGLLVALWLAVIRLARRIRQLESPRRA